MKKLLIPQFIFVFALVLTSGAAFAQDDELMAKVEDMSKTMTKAMMDGDFETLKSFYDENAISLPNYGQMLKGKEAIFSYMKQSHESGVTFNEVNFKPVKVKKMGDQALEIGKYKMSITVPGSSEAMNDEGKYLTVYNIQEDGSLKIAVEMWNTNTYPVSMSASSEAMD